MDTSSRALEAAVNGAEPTAPYFDIRTDEFKRCPASMVDKVQYLFDRWARSSGLTEDNWDRLTQDMGNQGHYRDYEREVLALMAWIDDHPLESMLNLKVERGHYDA